MDALIALPLKKTYDVDLTKPLKVFIQNTFSVEQATENEKALSDFNSLRTQVLLREPDKHESALEKIYRYYDQLVAIEGKLPISENQIRVQFKWTDAFDEGSFLGGKRKLALASGAYERICVLFNIAALQSQVGAAQNHSSDDGLKMTAKLYQQAAGILAHLKDTVHGTLQMTPTPDLDPDPLGSLSALMLAQGQEAYLAKAIQDKMKDSITAKVAYQTSELYSDAMKLMQGYNVRNMWPKEWLPIVITKQAAYHAMSEYYQSCLVESQAKHGECVARLRHANGLMDEAAKRGGPAFKFQTEQQRIKNKLAAAEKDNSLIYNDSVPPVERLAPVGCAALAKPTPLQSPLSSKFTDLFERMVPLQVHQAIATFDNRKSQIANMEVGRLREASQLINSVMSSLNLPAAVEDVSGDQVPQSLLEKAAKIGQAGGLGKIDQLMSDLPDLLDRNRDILNDCINMLDDEETSDKQLKDQFGERWSRTPSAKLTTPMRQEAGKYKSILDTAIQADHIVKEKYSQHRKAMELLSKTKEELTQALPKGSALGIQDSGCVQRLRDLIEKASTLKAERDVMESEIKNATFDMQSKFVAALAADGLINVDTMSEQELDKVYAPLREQVNDSMRRQEEVLSQLQVANTEFVNAKSNNQSGQHRETMLKDLAAGFDSFMELKGNLEEGTKFYNDLTPLLVRLQTKINDFCFARKTEKDDLMQDLQKAIANTPTQAPPVAPRYQGGPGAPPQAQGDSSEYLLAGTSSGSYFKGQCLAAANAPPAAAAGLPYNPNPPQPGQMAGPQPGQQPPPGQPGYGAPPGQWGAPAPYPGGYPGGHPMPAMPQGYNPYNPYMGYPQHPPQQPYPQGPPGYPQGAPAYPQQGQPYPHPGYPQQGPPGGYPQQGPPGGYPQQGGQPPYPGYPPR